MSHGKLFLLSTMSVCLSSLFSPFFSPALANPLIYSVPTESQNGGFQGELHIRRLGPLQLPKAVVKFENSQVNVFAVPDWLFDRNLVLSGYLVNAQVDVQRQTDSVQGLVYFIGGMWLTNLGSTNAIDVIDTASGEQLRGRIRSYLDNAFAFKPENGPMRRLPFADIKTIHSPRAYVFSVPATEGKVEASGNGLQFNANEITFAPTFGAATLAHNAKVPKSTLSGTEPGMSTAQIGTFIGLNIADELAPAIAIPLVLNKGGLTQGLREIKSYNATHGGAGAAF